MSSDNNNSNIPAAGADANGGSIGNGDRAPLTVTINGEELTEVITSDEVPDDYSEMDDNESVMDDLEEVLDADEGEMGGDGNALIVDQSQYTFSGHSDSVYCLKMHPSIDGLVVTGGGDDKAFLWRCDTLGQSLMPTPLELAGHTDSVATVDFNFDGSLVLTGGYDGLVKVWNVQTGALVCQLEGPEDVEWCQWHSKGNAVIAGSRDSTVWMWLTSTTTTAAGAVSAGQCVQVFAGHDGAVTAGCFSSDGKTVCSGGEDGSVRIWAPKTGVCRHVFEQHTGHTMSVNCMDSHKLEPELLLTGSMDGTVLLLQIGASPRVLQKFVHCVDTGDNEMDEETMMQEEQPVLTSVECVAFSPVKNLKLCASGGVDGTLKIWDYVAGVLRCECRHGDVVTSLKWHATLPIVATSSADLNIRLWDARNGTCLQEFTGHSALITGLDMRTLSTAVEVDVSAQEQTAQQQEMPANFSSSSSSSTTTMPPAPPTAAAVSTAKTLCTDVIASVSDDNTSKVYYFNAAQLLA